MKERHIPMEDIKMGARVVSTVGKETGKAAAPYIKHELTRVTEKVLRKFMRK